MESKPRFEYKYQLSVFEYLKARNRIRCFCNLDQYAQKAKDGKYYVRSLYWDTFDYNAYAEKITGEANRIKLRIRSYAQDPDKTSFVSVEIKTRSANQIKKFSTHVSLSEYEHFMDTGSWTDGGNPVLVEFERLRRLQNLAPKVVVEYFREAYVPKDRSDVRITFDHGIKFMQTRTLFSEQGFARSQFPDKVILEIKIKEEAPLWLKEVAKENNLKMVPNSKYADAVEHTQHALFI